MSWPLSQDYNEAIQDRRSSFADPELREAVPSAGYLAKRLVELVSEGGGTDNCTVVSAYCY